MNALGLLVLNLVITHELGNSPKVDRSPVDPPQTKKDFLAGGPSETSSKASSNKRKPKHKTTTPSKSKPPTSYQQLMKWGETNLIRGRVNSAKTQFKRAQKLKPRRPEPLAQLAWCELAHKKTRNAISLFKRALSLNAYHADSLYGLGYAYEKIGRAESAIKYFEHYLRRYPRGSKVSVIDNKMKRLKR